MAENSSTLCPPQPAGQNSGSRCLDCPGCYENNDWANNPRCFHTRVPALSVLVHHARLLQFRWRPGTPAVAYELVGFSLLFRVVLQPIRSTLILPASNQEDAQGGSCLTIDTIGMVILRHDMCLTWAVVAHARFANFGTNSFILCWSPRHRHISLSPLLYYFFLCSLTSARYFHHHIATVQQLICAPRAQLYWPSAMVFCTSILPSWWLFKELGQHRLNCF